MIQYMVSWGFSQSTKLLDWDFVAWESVSLAVLLPPFTILLLSVLEEVDVGSCGKTTWGVRPMNQAAARTRLQSKNYGREWSRR